MISTFTENMLLLGLSTLLIGKSLAIDGTLFDDPEFANQKWAFDMINIGPVWEAGFFGKGVRVRVNDDGVDSEHEEFLDRFDVDASCEKFEAKYMDGLETAYRQHGTGVASIVGASGNNGECAMGVAPEVTISSCKIIGGATQSYFDGTWLIEKLDHFDISQNSYGVNGCKNARNEFELGSFPDTSVCPFKSRGDCFKHGRQVDLTHPCDVCTFPSTENSKICADAVFDHCSCHAEEDRDACLDIVEMMVEDGECEFKLTRDVVKQSMETAAKEGRNGLGIVFVFAAGNNYPQGGNTNLKKFLQERFVIAVGAVREDGLRARYSAVGASLFVTAPGGDHIYDSRYRIAQAGGGCKASGMGTSIACPVVTGVIALMLEANPQLSWRDVQHIIVKTSTPITHTPTDDTSQVINGAGFWHSDMYGFGMINAGAAVEEAQKWVSYGEEVLLTVESSDLNMVIGDDPNKPTVTELVIGPSAANIHVENIEVEVYLDHLTRGHLKISLTSPDGTVSDLTPGSRPEETQLDANTPWHLRTVRSWGEIAQGTWTLSISDEKEGDLTEECKDDEDWNISWFTDRNDCAYLDNMYETSVKPYLDTYSNLYDGGLKEACCACGGGNNPGLECTDKSGFANECASLANDFVCYNGQVDLFFRLYEIEDSKGRTVRDACCRFGGGTDSHLDKLLGWKLNVYGNGEIVTASPTEEHSPSKAPSMAPAMDSFTSASSTRSMLLITILTALSSLVLLIR